MEQLNDNKIICHIVGLNPNDKVKIKDLCENISKYHMIDLDEINNNIGGEKQSVSGVSRVSLRRVPSRAPSKTKLRLFIGN